MFQGLANARYRFIAIDVGAYEKQSDGGIFRNNSLYQLLSSNNFNMPNSKKLPLSDVELPFMILGDEAYPLRSYLMRPYPRRQLTESRRVFNYLDVFPTVHHSIGYFFRTNFNAHFNMNMYVTLSSTCFGP